MEDLIKTFKKEANFLRKRRKFMLEVQRLDQTNFKKEATLDAKFKTFAQPGLAVEDAAGG